MSHVYIVEVHYDYESHSVVGIFSTEEEAQKVADEYWSDIEMLDGVFVNKEEVFNSYEDWNKQFDEVD